MDINATIVVQAFNFFIVYWMLRRFLFKPVIIIIEHEHAQENGMLDVIDQQQKSLEIQEKERQRRWYSCQEYFASHRPLLIKESLFCDEKSELDTLKTTVPSTDVVDRVVADMRTVIEEKIKHVH